jgi:hypothetical protein
LFKTAPCVIVGPSVDMHDITAREKTHVRRAVRRPNDVMTAAFHRLHWVYRPVVRVGGRLEHHS